MKNLISKSLVVAALMSPAITLFAASAHFGPGIDAYINTLSVSDTVQTDYSERKSNPLYDANGKEVVNPLYNPAKNLQTRKRVEVLKSSKNTEADNQRKGWDGSVKGNNIQSKHAINTKGTGGTKVRSAVTAETGSAVPNQLSKKGINESGINENESERKGITQSGIKITENERKGWDGSVKGNSKGINEAGIKRTDNQRKGWDGTVKGGSIQEESMNGSNNPAGSEQQKANINTSRSNIKSGLQSPTDSQHHRGIDKKDIKRGMTNETGTMQPIRKDSTSQNADRGVPVNRLKTKHDTAKNSVGNIR